MPYSIHKVKGGFQVRSPNAIHAQHTTKAKALAQVRLLQMIEHGGTPRNRKKTP